MQIGEVLALTGLPQLFLIPLVPRLMKRLDARLLVGAGFALFAGRAFLTTHLDADFAGPQFLLPNVTRAVGHALVLTPLSALATGGVEAENAGSASALFNMMCNLGGAIGIAVLQTAFTKREQFHSEILTSAVSVASEASRSRIAELTQYFPRTASPMRNGRSMRPSWRSAGWSSGRLRSWAMPTRFSCSDSPCCSRWLQP
jgi:MFS transporter, DHA2 family, multidrug resistance protein